MGKISFDNKKIELLQKLNNELAKARVITSLENDRTKIEMLPLINDAYSKAEIIASLADEEIRIELMKEILPSARTIVIATLSDDNVKESELDEVITTENTKTWQEKIRYSSYIISVIESFKNPEKRIEFLPLIDKLKFWAADKFGIEYHKAKIVATLESEKEKIEFLQEISDQDGKALIIASFTDDEQKIKYLELLTENEPKAEVIKSLSNDDKKLELISDFEEYDRANIISSLKDDEQKLKLLKKVKGNQSKALIITSLKEDVEKIKFLQSNFLDFDNSISCYYRKLIIVTLHSDELKLELLDTVKDDIYKAEIIATLGAYKEKNEKKNEVIGQIEAKKDRLEELVKEQERLENEQKRNTLIEKK